MILKSYSAEFCFFNSLVAAMEPKGDSSQLHGQQETQALTLTNPPSSLSRHVRGPWVSSSVAPASTLR